MLWDAFLFGIPGYLALAISAILCWRDWHRSRIKLRLVVSHASVVWNKDNESLVLFRLTFVNHSLSSQIVATTAIKPPQGITYKTFVYQYGTDFQEALCPDVDGKYTYSIPSSEVLRDALDIPAQQSRSTWHGVLLSWDSEEQGLEDVPFPIWFYAHDIDGKELAKYGTVITLKQLKNPCMYKAIRYAWRKK